MDRFEGIDLALDPAFRDYCEKNLAHSGLRQETDRASTWRKTLFRSVVALVLALILAAGALALGGSPFASWLGMATVLLATIMLAIWVAFPAIIYKRMAKARVTPLLVAWFGQFRFEQEPDFPLGDFNDWNLLPPWSRAKIGDVVTGHYRGVPVRFAEVEFVEKEFGSAASSDSNRDDRRIMKGMFAEYTLAESATGLTLFSSRNRYMPAHAEAQGWTPVESGHADFQAYVADNSLGRTSWPPDLLNTIARMMARLGTKAAFAGIGGPRLVVLLPDTMNLFEPTLHKKTGLAEQAKAIRNDLATLLLPVTALPIAPSVPVDDTPLDLDPEQLSTDADKLHDTLGGPGCLFMMAGSVLVFAACAVLLFGHDWPGAAMFAAMMCGLLVAWTAWDLLGLRRGEPVHWGANVFRLVLALGPVAWLLSRASG